MQSIELEFGELSQARAELEFSEPSQAGRLSEPSWDNLAIFQSRSEIFHEISYKF